MSRPQITCHILDTSSGKPAENVSCTLFYLVGGLAATADSAASFVGTGMTNSDGRIAGWDFSATNETNIAEAITQHQKLIPGHYKIRFDVKAYFDKKNVTPSFFPYIEVSFTVSQVTDEHYHIPLLLSNYSYSTYRGS